MAADPRPGSGNAAIVNKRAVPTRDAELVIRAPIEREEGKKPMPEKRKREEESGGGGESKVSFLPAAKLSGLREHFTLCQ